MADDSEVKVRDRRRLRDEAESDTPVSDQVPRSSKADQRPAVADDERVRNFKLDFTGFVMSIGTAALIELGEIEDPRTRTKAVNLTGSKHNIDILEMLLEKTVGNLNEGEKQLLESLLYELRIKFIAASKRAPSS